MIDRASPRERPEGRPAGFQRWRTLLFLHWQVPEEALRPFLPPGLSVDTFDGRAYVGVVPFTMRDVSPWWAPSVPGISNFHELNVRTYVHDASGTPGVWFFSLDAAGTVAVLLARLGWKLPYFRARMRLSVQGDAVRYESRRLFPGPKPARFEARYRIGEPIAPPSLGSLEYFLAERYVLFVRGRGDRLQIGRVHHRPYPLHRAVIDALDETMVVAAGLGAPEGAPHVLYSPGVDVDVYALRDCG